MIPTLRLLTIICYFLPFTFFLTTCNNGLEMKFSYNQKEADKNTLLEIESSKTQIDIDSSLADTPPFKLDTIKTLTDSKNSSQDTLKQTAIISGNFWDRILRQIIMPTDNSLSGIGSIFYFKTLVGQIAISTSLMTSIIILTTSILKSQKLKKLLLLTNIISVTTFILQGFYSNVTLLWGTWTLLLLLLLQIIISFIDKKKAYR